MATPERSRRVRMPELKEAVLAAGFDVIVDAHVLLVVRKGVESSVYDTGKVILKTTQKDEAEKAYAELRPLLQSVWT